METVKTFSDLAVRQVEMFQSDNLTWMSIMATGWQIQEIMIIAYRKAVRLKLLKPFEEWEDQNKVWQMVDEIGKGETDPKKRYRIALSLVSLEYLLQ